MAFEALAPVSRGFPALPPGPVSGFRTGPSCVPSAGECQVRFSYLYIQSFGTIEMPVTASADFCPHIPPPHGVGSAFWNMRTDLPGNALLLSRRQVDVSDGCPRHGRPCFPYRHRISDLSALASGTAALHSVSVPFASLRAGSKPAFCPQPPSDSASRRTPLPRASAEPTLPPLGCVEDLHLRALPGAQEKPPENRMVFGRQGCVAGGKYSGKPIRRFPDRAWPKRL
jgi:hypothetical protein